MANDLNQLIVAFHATTYRVYIPGAADIVLRIGLPNAALATLLAQTGVNGAVWLTADNPGGNLRDAVRNAAMRHALETDVRALRQHHGLPLWRADAQPDTADWPLEPGWLIGDLEAGAADRLAARFGQLAWLWIDALGCAKLRMTSPHPRRPPTTL